jgi:hypothetical protein
MAGTDPKMDIWSWDMYSVQAEGRKRHVPRG